MENIWKWCWLAGVVLLASVMVAGAQTSLPITDRVASRAYDGLQILDDAGYMRAIVADDNTAIAAYADRFNVIVEDVHKAAIDTDERGDFNTWNLMMITEVATIGFLSGRRDDTKMARASMCHTLLKLSIQRRTFVGWKVQGVGTCLNLPITASPMAVLTAAKKFTETYQADLNAEVGKPIRMPRK